MKKIIILAATAMIGLSAQGQIVSSRSSMTTREVLREPKEPKSITGWSTFGFEYNPSSWRDTDDGESLSFTSLALTYTHAHPLSQNLPLLLEWGIGAQYSFDSESYDNEKLKYQWASLKVPVNLIYDFEIPGTTINFDPFVGLKMRGNIWGEETYTYKDETKSYNMFDDDYGMKRFQIGWNIGAKVRFNNSFFVGLSYGSDFSEVFEDVKMDVTSISIGFVF